MVIENNKKDNYTSNVIGNPAWRNDVIYDLHLIYDPANAKHDYSRF